MNTKKILCFGNLNIDLTFFCSRLPDDHEKMKAENFIQSFGGAASNTAYWLSQLGTMPVYMVGCCGCDEYGRQFLNHFMQNGINTEYIQRSHRHTNVMSIWVTPGSKRMISAEGANQDFDLTQFTLDVFQPGMHFHAASRDANKVLQMSQWAKQRGMSISMEWDKSFDEHHANLSDICFINLDDFSRCFGVEKESISPSDISQKWQNLFEKSNSSLVVTMRNQGAMCLTPEGQVIFQPVEKVRKVVDRTGGGDAFDAGFLNVLLQKGSVSDALKSGLNLAAKVIQYQSSIPVEVTRLI